MSSLGLFLFSNNLDTEDDRFFFYYSLFASEVKSGNCRDDANNELDLDLGERFEDDIKFDKKLLVLIFNETVAL